MMATIHISDDLYAKLVRQAQIEEQSVDQLVADSLAQALNKGWDDDLFATLESTLPPENSPAEKKLREELAHRVGQRLADKPLSQQIIEERGAW